jgi:hypothetical protein
MRRGGTKARGIGRRVDLDDPEVRKFGPIVDAKWAPPDASVTPAVLALLGGLWGELRWLLALRLLVRVTRQIPA